MATSRPAANARTAPDPAPDAIGTFWRTPLPELLSALASRPAGLTTAEAEARLARYGPNVLRVGRKRTLPRLFLSRFRSPLVILLVVASGISALTGDAVSSTIIVCMALLSVTLDAVQEYRAGQAADRLRQSVAVRVSVLRDGVPANIPVADIVPGDVAVLSAGDLVPADGRAMDTRDCFANQALLTGEPYTV